MTGAGDSYRLYGELASWWPLISPPGEYADDAALIDAVFGSAGTPVRTLLDLGSGGGHVAMHLKRGRSMTLVDRSGEMLDVSRLLNPDCTHVRGDMRSVRLGQEFDGVLVHVVTLGGADLCEQVISRVKVMSELDIAERRVPQDGRFRIALKGRPIDFRVSVMPSVHGEDAVLRILDKQALTDELQGLRLDALGFETDVVRRLRRLSELPYGMLLVTGPTGSGKTTTLYAAISETNTGRDKIIITEWGPYDWKSPYLQKLAERDGAHVFRVLGRESIASSSIRTSPMSRVRCLASFARHRTNNVRIDGSVAAGRNTSTRTASSLRCFPASGGVQDQHGGWGREATGRCSPRRWRCTVP